TDRTNNLGSLLVAPPPTVIAVLVGGSTWTIPAYRIPVGSGAQLLPLPFVNLDQVSVCFSEDVVVTADSLRRGGVNVAAYAPAGFHYDPVSHLATWTLSAPLGTDKLLLDLAAGGPGAVHDRAGAPLDGAWLNPTDVGDTSGSTFPSGNGGGGGDF